MTTNIVTIRRCLSCQMPPAWQLLLYYMLRTSTRLPTRDTGAKVSCPSSNMYSISCFHITLQMPTLWVCLLFIHMFSAVNLALDACTYHVWHSTWVLGLELRSSSLHANHFSHRAIIPVSSWRLKGKENSSEFHSLLNQIRFLEWYLTQTRFK